MSISSFSLVYVFLSTLPVRGATLTGDRSVDFAQFLSTLPVRGATRRHQADQGQGQDFYPRSP